MSLSPQLQSLLAQLPNGDRVDFSALLTALYHVRHTGPITLHLFNGVPKQVDLGAPIRLSIVEGQRNGLDTETRSKAG